jgi:Ca2+:H+ antiporter
VLGLDPRDMVLLVMTMLVSLTTFGTGRTNILSGMVHALIFAVFIFLVLVP